MTDEIEGLKLTPRMRRVLRAAAEEARRRGHDFMGTEHMLLGLLAEPHGIAAQVLKELGADEEARQHLEAIFDSLGYHANVANHDLRQELLRRRDIDQAPRRKEMTNASIEEMRGIAEENAAWLKHVIAEHGWPGRSIVGNDGAEAAWLIAQHASHDLGFQRECLRLIEDAVAHGDAAPRNAAYLTDRVLVGEGKPQRYGTQFHGHDPFPIEDADHVNERRTAAGLPPLAEYAKHFAHYPKHEPDPWHDRLGREYEWWRDFLSNRLAGEPEYQARFDPARPLRADIAGLLPADRPPEEIRILDCASGPASALGRNLRAGTVELVAIDALATQYNELLSRLGLRPPVAAVSGTVEQLERMFPDAGFDLVYMSNALDHCRDPRLALEQMLKATRPGGVVLIEHYNHDPRPLIPQALPGAEIEADYTEGRTRVVIRRR